MGTQDIHRRPDPYGPKGLFGEQRRSRYAVSTRDRSRKRSLEEVQRVWTQYESGGTAAPAASQNAKSRAWVNAQLEGTGSPHRPTLSWAEWVAEYQCAKGHVFTEYTKEVVARKSCPVVWTGLGGGYWARVCERVFVVL